MAIFIYVEEHQINAPHEKSRKQRRRNFAFELEYEGVTGGIKKRCWGEQKAAVIDERAGRGVLGGSLEVGSDQ
jgi:hypothetical protein